MLNFILFDSGFHDLHHLNARIPCYNLRACHEELGTDLKPSRIRWNQVVQCMQMKLWDEDRQKMIGFPKEVRETQLRPAE